jgi:hypothetical protein
MPSLLVDGCGGEGHQEEEAAERVCKEVHVEGKIGAKSL